MQAATAIGLISDSLGLCAKAINELKKFTQTENHLKALIQNVERVRQSSELLLTVIPEMGSAGYADFSIALEPYDQQLRPLINDILARASEILAGQPRQGIIRRIDWTLTSSATEDFVANLKEVEAQIRHNVGLLTLWASARHLSLSQKVKDTEWRLANEPELEDAFSIGDTLVNADSPRSSYQSDTDETDVDPPPAIEGNQGTPKRSLRTWLGYSITTGQNQQYLSHRKALSDAAFYGEWDKVFRLIELGNSLYGESWANASRIRPPSRPYFTTLWTPLHQAVYMRAPIEVFERLIELGASRTLRTRWTEFSWHNMSALELAMELEVPWAFNILRPIIYQPIPQSTLHILQERFHAIILHELTSRELDKDWLYLPVLEVLTEFESESVWFPIPVGSGRKSGYMYRLDARHLLVWSINILARDTSAKYRITEEDIFQVHEALVFPESR